MLRGNLFEEKIYCRWKLIVGENSSSEKNIHHLTEISSLFSNKVFPYKVSTFIERFSWSILENFNLNDEQDMWFCKSILSEKIRRLFPGGNDFSFKDVAFNKNIYCALYFLYIVYTAPANSCIFSTILLSIRCDISPF